MRKYIFGFVKAAMIGFLVLSVGLLHAEEPASDKTIAIGSRLELFVDRYLVDEMDGVEFLLHRPTSQPMAQSPIIGGYTTIIKDGDIYRAFFRKNAPDYTGITMTGYPGEITCYAESQDGHEWIFPKDNVILREPPFIHNFSPFLDTRPDVPAGERFKALAGVERLLNTRLLASPPGGAPFHGTIDQMHERWGYPEGYDGGLYTFASADGIHWKRTSDKAVINVKKEKAFDSQNVTFWSEVENCYICYFRTWVNPYTGLGAEIRFSDGLRTISRTTSRDFIKWTKPVAMQPNLPGEHLYTSQTHPYFRAPHIYIALPTRFMPDRGSSTDILFMTSRAGSTSYDRLFTEAFIWPGIDSARWGNRSNYVALNVVPTGPTEMSIYHKSGHRYVLRTDGFVSIRAGAAEGELLTKPLTFTGNKLILNYSTSAAGSLKVEIQNPDGSPIAGFRLQDCQVIIGDKIDGLVGWKGNPDLRVLAGKPIRLRFVMTECDLYSFKFKTD